MSSGSMQILVKTTRGRSFTLDVEASDTIYNVKCYICDRWHFPVTKQGIIYAGQQLEDGRTLADYHI